MQFITFKKSMLSIALTLFCTASFAQTMVTLDKAGDLSKKIKDTEKFTITSLIVSGSINSDDVRFLREMAGRDMDGYETDGKLSSLDLSDAKIVMGGGNYYKVKRGLSFKYYNIKENDVVDSHMFYNCRSLTSLKLPKTVKKIEQYAMQYCKSLQKCTLPENLSEINDKAFANTNLSEVTFPASLTSIKYEAFYECSNLKTLRFTSSSVPTFGQDVFEDCSKLEKIYVPKASLNEYKDKLKLTPKVQFIGEDSNTAGINSLATSKDAVEVERYNAKGQRINHPVKGMNIIKLSNGKVVKRIER
ncbi:leucine-rich repeat domain-containing protein [Segatella oris]|uniref:leucine-rich repeat domain-containing protein n=1 Tax=Segatella oris TaxID=28135 RepID=UPI0028E5C46D|nr:leucine-rich repeat domain-containing protein [Segatella oris]